MTDRLPPHSIEAEQGVLGCILLSPNESLGTYVETIGSDSEPFYDLRHQGILDALLDMYDGRKPIDMITLQQWLKDDGKLEAIGGLSYLAGLQDAVPSSAHLGYYLKILTEKHTLRRMICACSGAVARIYDSEGDVDLLLDELERDVLSVRKANSNNGRRTNKELVVDAVNRIEVAHKSGGAVVGIRTGFSDLDALMRGLKPGNLVLLAARPGVGKTSFAMNIVEHNSLSGVSCGVFSLEMTEDELVTRFLCCSARVNQTSASDGHLTEGDMRNLVVAATKIWKAPWKIDDTSGLTIMQLRARARRMHQQHKIELLVVDYLQLIASNSKRAQSSKEVEISEVSNGLKALAKELKIPIIAVCQLNRDVEKDKKRKPRLSDLRGSGSLEQDSDAVWFLYADEEAEDGEYMGAMPMNLFMPKHRSGPTGTARLTFLKSLTRFESAAKIDPED